MSSAKAPEGENRRHVSASVRTLLSMVCKIKLCTMPEMMTYTDGRLSPTRISLETLS